MSLAATVPQERVPVQRLIPIANIDVNPLEPRARLVVDPELVQSIREHGLLQPIVVGRRAANGSPRPEGDPERFLLLAGHRRLTAMREIGAVAIPATVIDVDDDGGRILLAENVVRRDFDALEEAEIVGALIDRGMPYRAIGDSLGRSISWVARRANLRQLSPLVRKAIAGGTEDVASWPPAWLEELALLDPSTQEEFLGLGKAREGARPALLRNVSSLEHIREIVAKELRPLRLAKWDIEDAALVPSVGACSSCTKTSVAQPTLFGIDAPGASVELRDALCRDSRCWAGKLSVWLKQKRDAAVATHGRALRLIHDPSPKAPPTYSSDLPSWDGLGKVENRWSVQVVAKSEGSPALIVSGPRAGKVVFVAEPKVIGAPKREKPTAVEQLAALNRKRKKLLVEQFADYVSSCSLGDLQPPEPLKIGSPEESIKTVAHVLARVAAEGLTARGLGVLGGLPFRDSFEHRERRANGFLRRTETLAELLWDGIAGDLVEGIRLRAHGPETVEELIESLRWVGDLVQFDFETVLADIVRKLPDPEGSKQGKLPAPKRAKRSTVKRGAIADDADEDDGCDTCPHAAHDGGLCRAHDDSGDCDCDLSEHGAPVGS